MPSAEELDYINIFEITILKVNSDPLYMYLIETGNCTNYQPF